MEGGEPVVVWKEHDHDSCPWVGREAGGLGWPVFTSREVIPKLQLIGVAKRVPIPMFPQVEEKAKASVQSWRRYLGGVDEGVQSTTAVQQKLRERYTKAVDWWPRFLEEYGPGTEQWQRPDFVTSDWLPYLPGTHLPLHSTTPPSSATLSETDSLAQSQQEPPPLVVR